ncbi:MAG: transporter [Cyclobacteriaceae bacterium]
MKELLSIALLLFALASVSQGSESIVTDRPTQSASAFVLPQGDLLLEAGVSSEKVTAGIRNSTFLNALLRWGLTDGIELRLTQNYLGSKVLGERNSGFSPLTLGTKVHLMQEDGWKPQMSVIGQITLRTGDNRFKPSSSISEFRFNFQNTLSDNLSLGYNIGFISGENDYILYSAVLGVALADGWSVFAEPYGFFGDGDSDQRFNAGVIYLYQPNLQFDVSFGSGISKIAPDSFVGFGVAWGFN